MAVRTRSVPAAVRWWALLLLPALVLAGFGTRTPAAADPAQAPDAALFAAELPLARELRLNRLDPMTLADLPAESSLTLAGEYPNWALSADRTTMAVISYPRRGGAMIAIRNGLGGGERARFEVTGEASFPHLSRDGSRLVTQLPQSCGPGGCNRPEWRVYDTTDGRLLATVEGEGQGVGGAHHGLVDADASRLYIPIVPVKKAADGPLPMEIVAYDLATGGEIGRAHLTDVLAGAWWSRSVDGVPVGSMRVPAVALAPDGSRLAVVDAGTDRMLIVETETMAVVRIETPGAPERLGQRALDLIGLLPRSAEAKYTDGTVLDARFAPDGRHLYLWGRTATIGDSVEEITVESAGIQRIDIDAEEIVAKALVGEEIERAWVAADGGALFVHGPDEPWETAAGEPGYHLRRLDPRSLEVEAERAFPAATWVMVV